MLIVGLTGGIATGKSTVSKTVKEYGIPVVDADVLARQVVEPGRPAYLQILQAFQSSTPDLLLADKSLNRPALGRRIFNDDGARKTLNGITHPAVRRAMTLAALKHWVKGQRMIVLDVPLLFEGGLDMFCGSTVVVACSDALQMERLMARDTHLSQEDATSRVRSQMSIEEKKRRADIVIDNNGTIEELKRRLDVVMRDLKPNYIMSLMEWLIPTFGLNMGFWTLFLRYLQKRRRVGMQDQAKSKL